MSREPMSEPEWLSCTSYQKLSQQDLRLPRADELPVEGEGIAPLRRMTPRERRLLVCALARQGWEHLGESGRLAVQWGEKIALDLRIRDVPGRPFFTKLLAEARLERISIWRDAKHVVTPTWLLAARDAAGRALGSWHDLVGTPVADDATAAYLFHEIAGNPYRHRRWPLPSPTLSPLIVSLLATAVQEARDGLLERASLAVLADALEEHGCLDATLLAHLRRLEPHPLGCHAVTSLLGLVASIRPGG